MIADAVLTSIMMRAVVRSLLVVCVLGGIGLAESPASAAPAASVEKVKAKKHHHKKKVKARRKHRHHHKSKHSK